MMESSIEEVETIGRRDVIMEEYVKESVEASNIEDILGVYDKELDDRRIRNVEEDEYLEKGKQEGLQEGIEQINIEFAKNMLK